MSAEKVEGESVSAVNDPVELVEVVAVSPLRFAFADWRVMVTV